MKDIIAIVLAAGKGTRMKSDIPKVMHEILGRPIISHILDSLRQAGVTDIIIVAGYGGELLKSAVKNTRMIVQKRLLGSGDAILTCKAAIGKYSGDVLIICGDTPLVRASTIKSLMEKHSSSKASLTILTAELKDPTGYGRIVRREDGKISKIVEETEARLYEEVINEINVGTYCFNAGDMFGALAEVKPDNSKKELFLTDTIEILCRAGKTIESVTVRDEGEIIGINTRKDLSRATRILKDRVLEEVMSSGVTVEDPFSTTIYPGVKIGRDTIIHPNTIIESDVEIGASCKIGPFVRIRNNVCLADNVEIGNFVELVRTTIGRGTRVKHHTYLGDTIIGKNVNVGAGTITANYDGKNKNRTIIEDGASIGVGAILIAPLVIGRLALVGAGSVVPKNHNVPSGATVAGVPARVLKVNKKGDKR